MVELTLSFTQIQNSVLLKMNMLLFALLFKYYMYDKEGLFCFLKLI